MSGQLVGEVIAAVPQLRALGLSSNGFHALLAIAEKCHHISRQGSVPRSWIQAAIYSGNSTRTTERAVSELRDLKLIDVVKRGYKAPGQKAMASTYELLKLPPSMVADADAEAPARPEWRELAPAKSGEAPAKSGEAPAIQGGGLNGLPNGFPNGVARAGERTAKSSNESPWPTTPQINSDGKTQTRCGTGGDREALPAWAIPPEPCPEGGNCERSCRHCAATRLWNTEQAQSERQDANYRQAHREWNRLMAEARTGTHGDWMPVKPPLNRSGFDPNIPWRQPIPPPEPAFPVNGIDQW